MVIVLDRSGSMETGRSDHEGGLRSFVRDQRALAGDVRLTFVRFDSHDPFELVYDGVLLTDVDDDKLSLLPRGGTPLYDALGRTLTHVNARLGKLQEQPDQVVVMIITDGQENSSTEFTKALVKSLVEAREKSGWKVLYLGANVDEFVEGSALGVAKGASLGYGVSSQAIGAAYASISNNMAAARSMIQTTGVSATVGEAGAEQIYSNYMFTKKQRESAKPKDETTQNTTNESKTS